MHSDPTHVQGPAVRLEVVRAPWGVVPVAGTCVFETAGGSIGRSWRNDWMLADAECLVSRRHARIEWRDGRFGIVDLSRNGVYVDDDEQPLGPGAWRALDDGTRIRLCRRGQYLLAVQLQGAGTMLARDDAGDRRPSQTGQTP